MQIKLKFAFPVLMLGLCSPAFPQATEYLPVGENIVIHATPTPDVIDGKPCVAASGTQFFVAWRTNSGRVAGTRVTREGAVLDPAGITLGSGSSYPSAGWDGTHFFVVWVSGTAIVGVRVNPDGSVVDATPLSLIPSADSYPRPCPIAFDGTNYLITWRTNSQYVQAARISQAGILLDPPTGVYLGGGFYPCPVWGDGEYFVVWHAWGSQGLDVYGARVSAEGTVIAPGAFLVSSRPYDQDHASAAFDGTNYLVTWAEAPSYQDFYGDLYAARVSKAGAVLDAEPIHVAERYYRSIACPVIFDGENFLIAWKRGDTRKNSRWTDAYARRMRGDGTFVEAVPFPLSTAESHQFNPYIACADGVLLAAWLDGRSGRAPSGTGLVMGQVMRRTNAPPAPAPETSGGTGVPNQAAAGSSWTAVSSPTGANIYTIAGRDQDSFFAVGDKFTMQLESGQWNYGIDVPEMYGIWAGLPDIVRAVGWYWTVAGYSGGAWDPGSGQGTGNPVDPYQIGFGIWGADANHIMTVGTEGAYQFFDGTQWNKGATGVTYVLYDAWGTDANNIYAVGEAGTIMRYNGSAWSKVAGIPTGQCLNSIWGTGAGDIFVVGDYGTILHYNGSAWTKQATGTTEQLFGVSGFNGHDVYAVGIDGTILHYNGFSWQAEASGVTADLLDVAAAGQTVWAVGHYGTILKKEITGPEIGLSKTSFLFGAAQNGPATPAETLTVSNTGIGTLNWTATGSDDWISVTPGSGTGAGLLAVGIARTDLMPGTYTGTVTVSDPAASNSPQVITVNYQVYDAAASTPPFGAFDMPTDGTTVASSIPVTGWALDNVGVQSVKIYRGTGTEDRAFIGDAVFVEGARNDVEAAYPGYPQNSRAGWGYMMLTNFLPLGDGPYNLLAYATDLEGNEVLLGSKAITVNNANAILPFGAIDTPTQGGTASGALYYNFGWALTPQPNSIPINGLTITVWVNGLPLGHPSYNHYRPDIATLFPGYANANGAVGVYNLDTTAYPDDVHTIAWSVQDSAGNTDGIGSRYFSIQNTGGSPVPGGAGENGNAGAGENVGASGKTGIGTKGGSGGTAREESGKMESAAGSGIAGAGGNAGAGMKIEASGEAGRGGGKGESKGAGMTACGMNGRQRPVRRSAAEIAAIPEDARTPIYVRIGWGNDGRAGVMASVRKDERGKEIAASAEGLKIVLPEADGSIRIAIPQVTRLAVYLNEADAGETNEVMVERGTRILSEAKKISDTVRYEAYELALGELRPLPIGASFDARAGILYWQPGPGFLGEFCFVIIDREEMIRRTIRIAIR